MHKRILLLLLVMFPVMLSSQALVSAFWKKGTVSVSPGSMISNVLCVTNGTDAPLTVSINIIPPGNWRTLLDTARKYEIPAADTIYIPVRILPPPKEISSNTQFPVIAEVVSVKSSAVLGRTTFISVGPRVVGWNVNTTPSEVFYFKQNSQTANLAVDLHNTGNADQSVFVSLHSLSSNFRFVDTTKRNVEQTFNEILLRRNSDTTLNYTVSYEVQGRNITRLDIDNFRPRSSTDEQVFTMNLHTSESKLGGEKFFSTNKNIRFKKPANILKVNKWGNASIPLIAELNTFNIMGNLPGANLVLRGNYQIGPDRTFSYFVQQNFFNFKPSLQTLRNNFFTLSYADKKMVVSAGNINGMFGAGIPMTGKGISGLYHLTKQHSVGLFATRGPGFLGVASRYAFGVAHQFRINKNFNVLNLLGRVQLVNISSAINFFSTRLNYHFRNHNIYWSGTLTSFTSPALNVLGALTSVGYSGVFLKKKIVESLRFTYNNAAFGNAGTERIQIINRSQFNIKSKLSLILQNNFNKSKSISSTYDILTFNNQLFLPTYIDNSRISGGVFYNYAKFGNEVIHFRGVGIDYSYFSQESRMRLFSSTRMGYNKLPTRPGSGELFTFTTFNSIQYRVFTFIARYIYGPTLSPAIYYNISRTPYPQSVYLSIQHQYQFRNQCYVVQSNITYSANKGARSQNAGLYTELYYFSYSNWRFKLSAGYNISYFNNSGDTLMVTTDRMAGDISQNLQFGLGIRKEFGLKVPKKWARIRYFTVTYVAFIDNNGNGIRDRDEIDLENVVVKNGDLEVITNKSGKAVLANVKMGTYPLRAFSLDNISGYYPNIQDSIDIQQTGIIYIPFTKAVQVSGSISLNKIIDDGNQVFLDNIRVTAVSASGSVYSTLTDKNGNFQLYVPAGTYTISVNEMQFGENYVLAQNNIIIDLSEGVSAINQSFIFNERPRKINKKTY